MPLLIHISQNLTRFVAQHSFRVYSDNWDVLAIYKLLKL